MGMSSRVRSCVGSTGKKPVFRKSGITTGILAAGLVAGTTVAQEPTPNTFVDVPVPQLTEWNEVNYLERRTGY